MIDFALLMTVIDAVDMDIDSDYERLVEIHLDNVTIEHVTSMALETFEGIQKWYIEFVEDMGMDRPIGQHVIPFLLPLVVERYYHQMRKKSQILQELIDNR